jgi:WD40 repeat protein
MKASPLIINWHDQNAPIYSAHFEPNGKGRLATAGGDNHVRVWKVEADGPERKVEYLSTLSKHNQAVNVVRWAPKGKHWPAIDSHCPASEKLTMAAAFKERRLLRLAMTAMSSYGFPARFQPPTLGRKA